MALQPPGAALTSHLEIANVWEGLQSRTDISNILREILGQHTLDLLNVQIATADALRPVLWIKAIFDLQRAYLQATAGAVDCPVPGLLSTELVFSTLMYLLHVKSRLFPGNIHLEPDRATQRLHLTHTLLSGVRLLLLRNEYIAPEDIKRLENTVEAVWTEKDLPDGEHFVVSELLPEALDTESPTENQAGREYADILRQHGVPLFVEGLVSFLVRLSFGSTD
jgi:hypothetical protein